MAQNHSILKIRNKLGLSQSKFSEIVGLPQAKISQIETGKKKASDNYFKKKYPKYMGEEQGYKVYTCSRTAHMYEIFKDNKLVRTIDNKGTNQDISANNLTTLLIGLSLLSGNTPSTTISTSTSLSNSPSTQGTFSYDRVSGQNRICFYNTPNGEYAKTISSGTLCPRILNYLT